MVNHNKNKKGYLNLNLLVAISPAFCEVILFKIISCWYMLFQIKVWDTVAPSSGSSSCVGSTHINSSSPPIAMKCHESLCYMAAGSEVTMVDLRTMKKASVLALDNHRILSCEMLPSEWLICTGTKDK